MITILAADTSTSINTVALCRGETGNPDAAVLAEMVVECRRLHAERLLDAVDWVFAESGFSLKDVDVLAVSTGPGSFTGLRIGVAAWKGLAFAQQLPLLGVPTLDAMSRLLPMLDGVVCPLLDARMKEVYGTAYRYRQGVREKLYPDRAGKVEDFLGGLSGPVWFLGDGAALYRKRIEASFPDALFAPGFCAVPRAAAIAAEALHLLGKGACADAAQVSPVYIRASQAEINRDAKKQDNACPLPGRSAP